MAICGRKETKLNTAIKLAAIFAVACSLFACGDDSGNSSKANDDGNREVATLAEMGRCTSEREGDTVYVAEKLTDYLCKNKSWVNLDEISDGETAQSSSSALKGISSSNAADSAQGFIRENISVTGAAQKGPFKFGSPLELRELRLHDDSLVYSGRKYVDEISSNKGDFVIPKVSLVYPYVELIVRGLWRNEVTGEWSKDTMTLQSLTDLSERTEANVNLLTHLEYDRVKVLVNNGYSVSAAKKQADYEIMTAFGFATTIKYSEDLSIFDDRDDDLWYDAANATLLAMSVLFMGDRNDSEIRKAIEAFRQDVAKDGEWNDEETKAQMADWAQEFDNSKVRANVKSWNILEIPAYEGYMMTFWNNAYGLGGCASTRYGVVSPNTNKLSKNYGVHYICEAAGWRKATDYEKDTYGWDKGEKGDVKKGDVTGTYYVFENDKWIVAKNETALGLCEVSRNGEVGKIDSSFYICKEKKWVQASVLEYDTYQFGKGNDGEVRPGKVNADNFYVYENGKWRASASAVENNLGACVASREGEVDKSGNTYYICKSKTWTTASALEYDTYGWETGTEGEVKAGSVNADRYYVYENGKWRASASEIENNLGACVMSRESEKEVLNGKYYICQSKNWIQISAEEYGLGFCTAMNEGVVSKLNNIFYICKSNVWKKASILEYDTYGWEAGEEGEMKTGNVYTSTYYIYKDGKWQTASRVEENLGGCIISREGEVAKSDYTYYICKSKVWTMATILEYDTYGWIAGDDGEVRAGNIITSNYYIYKDDCWQNATEFEYDTYGKSCLMDGSIVEGNVHSANHYVCDAGEFRSAENLEISLDKGCVSYTEGNIIRKSLSASQDSVYLCNSSLWKATIEFVGEYGSLTDTRDNKTYKTVVIGTQTWMAENLNYSDSLTYVGMKGRSWCYNKNVANCVKYGRLYSWAAAMDSAATWSTNGKDCGYGSGPTKCSATGNVRGVCPDGWHLPSKLEWEMLFSEVGGQSIAGRMLKYNSENNTDAFGFAALLVGLKDNYYGTFTAEGLETLFWSSTSYSKGFLTDSYGVELYDTRDSTRFVTRERGWGLSVRCVKDEN